MFGEKKMEAIINFLKNGVAITFYGVLLIFGIFTLYGTIKTVIKGIFKRGENSETKNRKQEKTIS